MREPENKLLHSVFDGIQDGICILDTEFNIVRTNKTMDLWYSHEVPLAGKKCFRVFHNLSEPCQDCPSQTVFKQGTPQSKVKTQKGTDGIRKWYESYAFPFEDDAGNVIGTIKHMRDITDRKRAEEMSTRLGRILDNSFNEIYIFDAHSLKFLHANLGALQNTGYTLKEMHRLTPLDLKPYFNVKKLKNLLSPLSTGLKDSLVFETIQRRKDGTLYPVEVRLQLSDSEPRPVYVAIIQDISKRKQAEKKLKDYQGRLEELVEERTEKLTAANLQLKQEISNKMQVEKELQEHISFLTETKEELRESEERYRKLVELSPDAIVVHSEGRINFINTAGVKLLGAAGPEEIIGKPVLDFVPTDEITAVKEKLRQISQTGEDFPDSEERVLRLNGTTVDVEVTGTVLTFGGKEMVQLVARDITQRKRTQDQLQKERDFNHAVLDTIGALVLVIDPQGRIIRFNRACELITGYSFEEVYGKSVLDLFITPGDLPWIKHAFKELQAGGFPKQNENNWVTKNGSYRLISWSNTGIIGDDGNVQFLISTGIDITEQRQAEEALRLSEERFSTAFNASPTPMAINKLSDGSYINVNESFLAISGYRRHEIVGRTPQELNLWTQAERDKIMQVFYEQGYIYNMETYFRTKSGQLRIGLFSASKTCIDGVDCMIRLVNDITDLRQMQNEMVRLDRMNLLGEMAAGIAHEIRNPMTTVRGFLQMLGEKEDCFKYKNYYDLMINELDRANSIVTEFLTMAKHKPEDLRANSLNKIIESIYPLIQADAMYSKKYVNVELSDIPTLYLDEKAIRQLILNLARNGLEAMPAGGNLAIKTFTDSEDVVMAVIDQGEGFDGEVLKKFGTPFMTTKENGTGLGLTICNNIADRHKATIVPKTGPNGTTIFVRFKAYSIKNNLSI